MMEMAEERKVVLGIFFVWFLVGIFIEFLLEIHPLGGAVKVHFLVYCLSLAWFLILCWFFMKFEED